MDSWFLKVITGPTFRDPSSRTVILIYMNDVIRYKDKEWYENALKRIERQKIVVIQPETKPVYKSEWKKEWKLYRENVRIITKEQDLQSLEHYEKRVTRESLLKHGYNIYRSTEYYTLDHKTSIRYGWKNNIPAEEIGHISNLRYVPAIHNSQKGIKCE